MAKKRKKKYMYGKPHHIKFPYLRRIYEACDECLNKVREFSSDYRVNNLIVDLRNEMCRIMGEIYQQLSIELEHNITIDSKKRKVFDFIRSTREQRCVICGEQRTVHQCHIIPREHSGSGLEDNIVYLCPTHHFLFDQARLSEEEFKKISVSGKAKDSVDFFLRVHKVRHQMYWKYGTNKSTGCTCGSLDFDYDVTENGNFAQPCLICRKCKAVWLLGANHPLVKELSIEAYEIFDQITEREKQKRIDKAKEIVRGSIAKKNLKV